MKDLKPPDFDFNGGIPKGVLVAFLFDLVVSTAVHLPQVSSLSIAKSLSPENPISSNIFKILLGIKDNIKLKQPIMFNTPK